VGERSDERAPLEPVRIEERLDEGRLELQCPVEAEVAAPLGEPGEELRQGLGIVGPGRAEAQRAAVAEDDVHEAAGAREGIGPGALGAPGPRGVRQPLGRGGHTPLSVRRA
jgi:hypothetical protein